MYGPAALRRYWPGCFVGYLSELVIGKGMAPISEFSSQRTPADCRTARLRDTVDLGCVGQQRRPLGHVMSA
jgi:hypothetical protein